MENLSKRQFLAAIAAGVGLASNALAQEPAAVARKTDPDPSSPNRRTPSRRARTTKLFKAPDGFPNAIAVTDEGLWIAEQKETGQAAAQYRLPSPRT